METNKPATPETYESLYVQFIYHFNVTFDYFECHEVLEELWLETGRDPLYQGLLQVAVGLHHHNNGNVSGAIKLFSQAIDKIQHYPDNALGIDLAFVLDQSRTYLVGLQADASKEFQPFLVPVHDGKLQALVDEWAANAPEHGEDEGD